jgi:cytochrome P450
MTDVPILEYEQGFEQMLDPFSEYDRLRELGPVVRVAMPNGMMMWHVLGFREGQAVLVDQRFSKDFQRMAEVFAETGQTGQQSGFVLSGATAGHLLNSDPPVHTRLRRLVNRAFTPRRIAEIEADTETVARELLAANTTSDEFDLIDAYAYPLTITVICQLLGVPSADRQQFREWAMAATTPKPAPGSTLTIQEGAAALLGYLRQVIAQSRPTVSGPPEDQPDLISAMIAAEESGGLTDDEIVAMTFLLLIAGHETTVGLIGTSMLNLFAAPEQLALLRAEPDRIPAAVEECLRVGGSVQRTTFRVAVEDVEVAGVTIPKGALCTVALGAANRDPQAMTCPHAFDITKEPQPHIAFGYGPHFCLGAALARMEVGVALRVLLDTFTTVELDIDQTDVVWTPGVIRSPLHVPIRTAQVTQ